MGWLWVKSAYLHGRYDVCFDHWASWRLTRVQCKRLPQPISFWRALLPVKPRCCGEPLEYFKVIKKEFLVCRHCGRERRRVLKRTVAYCGICEKVEPLSHWELV